MNRVIWDHDKMQESGNWATQARQGPRTLVPALGEHRRPVGKGANRKMQQRFLQPHPERAAGTGVIGSGRGVQSGTDDIMGGSQGSSLQEAAIRWHCGVQRGELSLGRCLTVPASNLAWFASRFTAH